MKISLNRKRLITLFSLIFVAMILVSLLIQRSEEILPRDYPEIQKFGVLNVSMEYNTSDYYLADDSIVGMQYELCKYISERSGLDVNILLENNLGTSIEYLKNQTVDIIARNIPVTVENRNELNFTVPVRKSKQVLIQRKRNPENDSTYISNQIQLAHKTIYLPEGSTAILRIKNLSDEIAEPIYIKEIKEYAQEQILYMVAFGEIDYAVIDREIALMNQTMFPEIDLHVDISFTQLQAWAVRKDSPVLLDSLNIWITEYNLF